jgi:hypothetical protein
MSCDRGSVDAGQAAMFSPQESNDSAVEKAVETISTPVLLAARTVGWNFKDCGVALSLGML